MYGNTIDFCILILQPGWTHLLILKVFTRSLRIFICNIMLSENIGHTFLFLCMSHNFLLETGYFRQEIIGNLSNGHPPGIYCYLLASWLILVKSLLLPSSPASWGLLFAPPGAHPWECWQSPWDDWFLQGSFDSLPLDHSLLLNSTKCRLHPCLQQHPEAPIVSQPNLIKLGSLQRMSPNISVWNLFRPQESSFQLSLSPISVLQTPRSLWFAFLCAIIWGEGKEGPSILSGVSP